MYSSKREVEVFASHLASWYSYAYEYATRTLKYRVFVVACKHQHSKLWCILVQSKSHGINHAGCATAAILAAAGELMNYG